MWNEIEKKLQQHLGFNDDAIVSKELYLKFLIVIILVLPFSSTAVGTEGPTDEMSKWSNKRSKFISCNGYLARDISQFTYTKEEIWKSHGL